MNIQIILNAQNQEYQCENLSQFVIKYKYIGMQRNVRKKNPFWKGTCPLERPISAQQQLGDAVTAGWEPAAVEHEVVALKARNEPLSTS